MPFLSNIETQVRDEWGSVANFVISYSLKPYNQEVENSFLTNIWIIKKCMAYLWYLVGVAKNHGYLPKWFNFLLFSITKLHHICMAAADSEVVLLELS